MPRAKKFFEFQAQFRFYEELNDFLPVDKRKRQILYAFNRNPSVKDAIESFGIPHPEVDLIIANGESVGFDYHVRNNDLISVYPVFESIDISPIVKLRESPLRNPAFILDVHLGKLARLMRMLGFDVMYRNDYDDPEIIRISVREKRIILTRDRKLLHAKIVTHGYCLRSQIPLRQIEEVLERFDLYHQTKPFSKCLACGGNITKVSKQDIIDLLEPKTKLYYDTFYQCENCRKIYWEGSHFGGLRKDFAHILSIIKNHQKTA